MEGQPADLRDALIQGNITGLSTISLARVVTARLPTVRDLITTAVADAPIAVKRACNASSRSMGAGAVLAGSCQPSTNNQQSATNRTSIVSAAPVTRACGGSAAMEARSRRLITKSLAQVNAPTALRVRQTIAEAPEDPVTALAALRVGGFPKVHVIDWTQAKTYPRKYHCSGCDKVMSNHTQTKKINCWGLNVDPLWAARLVRDITTIERYKADQVKSRELGIHVWPATCSVKYMSCLNCGKTITGGNRYTRVGREPCPAAPPNDDRPTTHRPTDAPSNAARASTAPSSTSLASVVPQRGNGTTAPAAAATANPEDLFVEGDEGPAPSSGLITASGRRVLKRPANAQVSHASA